MDQLDPFDDEPQVMQVRVTNRNTFSIDDMFDGTKFLFEPSRPITIPVDAAHHIFGWFAPFTDSEGHRHEPDPTEMRRHTMRRFGWNTPAMEKVGDIYWQHIDIKPIVYRMVPVAAEEDEPLPAPQLPKPSGRVNKVMAAADSPVIRA
jgi:hypothetical protein